jgi:hypothetical protein
MGLLSSECDSLHLPERLLPSWKLSYSLLLLLCVGPWTCFPQRVILSTFQNGFSLHKSCLLLFLIRAASCCSTRSHVWCMALPLCPSCKYSFPHTVSTHFTCFSCFFRGICSCSSRGCHSSDYDEIRGVWPCRRVCTWAEVKRTIVFMYVLFA